MPTARWFDGAAPVATDAVRDAPTSGARREPRRSLRGGPKTDDGVSERVVSDASRVPKPLSSLSAQRVIAKERSRARSKSRWPTRRSRFARVWSGITKKAARNRRTTTATAFARRRRTYLCAPTRSATRANPANPTTRLRRRTSPFPDDDEERFSYDDDAHMAVSRLVTATVGDAAVFTRAAAQNAPTATLLAHDAGAGGNPANPAPAARSRALDSPRAAVERLRSFQKLPERLNDRTRSGRECFSE